MKQLRLTIAVLFLITPFASQAGIIWDEGVDGDLSSSSLYTDLGTLGGGSFDIFGSLDGAVNNPDCCDGPDEFDRVSFTALGLWTFDVLSVSGVDLLSVLFGTSSVAFSSGLELDVWGEHGAGYYEFALIPLGNAGSLDYSVRINVTSVPEPGTLALLGLGLFGIGLAIRKKKV